MVAAGRFLELSVPAPDIRASLEFYLRLGFTEIPTNDIRKYHYAAVSDGRMVIGLHGDVLDECALTFVQPDVAGRVQQLADGGVETHFQRIGTDVFHEAGLKGPDGHLIIMIEARTFSRTQFGELPAPIIGRSGTVVLRCNDLERGTVFFEGAGFTQDAESADTRTMIAPGIGIILDENLRSAEPVLRFRASNPDAALNGINAAGIDARIDAGGHLLRAPEGTRILLSDS